MTTTLFRNRLLLAAAAALAASWPQVGAAQWTLGHILAQEDVTRIQAAAMRLNGGASIGDVERWRSLHSKTTGEVKLVGAFTYDGMPCHELRYVVRFNDDPDDVLPFSHTWCRIVDGGAWKIFELTGPNP